MIKRFVVWIAFNIVYGSALYFGFVEEVDVAYNVAALLTWLLFLFSLAISGSPDALREVAKHRAAMPEWWRATDDAIELCVVTFLAWHGAWVLCVVSVFRVVFTLGAVGAGRELLDADRKALRNDRVEGRDACGASLSHAGLGGE